jgi:HTH-type transcriptional regulator/antitoxin HigA
MNIKPIKTKSDHRLALKRVEELWDAKPKTQEGDELDVLATLVVAYEEIHFPIDPAQPIEAIKFRMEQYGLSDSDLTQYIGARSKVSEVLNLKRSLSLSMIRKLSEGLKIPVDSLVREYQLSVNQSGRKVG